MTDDVDRRDLAEIGADLGDEDARAWRVALRSIASASRFEFGSEEFLEFVAGQVYGETGRGDPDQVAEYVETFLAVYNLDDMGNVDWLLGRERFERNNYAGRLGMIGADDD